MDCFQKKITLDYDLTLTLVKLHVAPNLFAVAVYTSSNMPVLYLQNPHLKGFNSRYGWKKYTLSS